MAVGEAHIEVIVDWPRLSIHYTSTACFHEQHDKCRLTCKYCNKPCRCDCHEEKKND